MEKTTSLIWILYLHKNRWIFLKNSQDEVSRAKEKREKIFKFKNNTMELAMKRGRTIQVVRILAKDRNINRECNEDPMLKGINGIQKKAEEEDCHSLELFWKLF